MTGQSQTSNSKFPSRKAKAIGAAIALSAAGFGAYKLTEDKEGVNPEFAIGTEAEKAALKNLPEKNEFAKLYENLHEAHNLQGPDSESYKKLEAGFLEFLNKELKTHPALEGYKADVSLLFKEIDTDLYKGNDVKSEEYRAKFKSALENLLYYLVRYNNEDSPKLESLRLEQLEQNIISYGEDCSKKNIIKHLIDNLPPENRHSFDKADVQNNPWYEGEIMRIKTNFELQALRERHGDDLSVIDYLSRQDRDSEVEARKAALKFDATDTILNSVRIKILSDPQICKRLRDDIAKDGEKSFATLFALVVVSSFLVIMYKSSRGGSGGSSTFDFPQRDYSSPKKDPYINQGKDGFQG